MRLGHTPNDEQWADANAFRLWTTGEDLHTDQGHVSPIRGTAVPCRAVAHIRICELCGRHYDSVWCECGKETT